MGLRDRAAKYAKAITEWEITFTCWWSSTPKLVMHAMTNHGPIYSEDPKLIADIMGIKWAEKNKGLDI